MASSGSHVNPSRYFYPYPLMPPFRKGLQPSTLAGTNHIAYKQHTQPHTYYYNFTVNSAT